MSKKNCDTYLKDKIECFANLGIWVGEEKPYEAYAHLESAIPHIRHTRYGGHPVEDYPVDHPDADVEGDQGVQVLEGDVVGYGRVACRLHVKTCETMRREQL